MNPTQSLKQGILCLRFDIDTNYTPWRRANFCSIFGDDEPEFLYRLVDQLQALECPSHFFAMGFGVIDYAEVLRHIVRAGIPLDSHLHTHRVTLLDDYNVVYEEILTAHWLLESVGAHIHGVGATGMYPDGINHREDIQQLLLSRGYGWVSSRWNPGRLLPDMQPYRLPSGLWELPCAGWSDMTFFHMHEQISVHQNHRVSSHNLNSFIEHVRQMIHHAARDRLVYAIDLHPAVLALNDPRMIFLPEVVGEARRAGLQIRSLRDISDLMDSPST